MAQNKEAEGTAEGIAQFDRGTKYTPGSEQQEPNLCVLREQQRAGDAHILFPATSARGWPCPCPAHGLSPLLHQGVLCRTGKTENRMDLGSSE